MPTEINLAPLDALQEGELRAFPTPNDGPEVLLVRHQGQYRAFAAHCPHYGAPLEKGRLVHGQIVCPWHHACFKATDGSLCEPPALDALPTFAVREAEGRVYVSVPDNPPASTDKPDETPTAEVGGAPVPTAPNLAVAQSTIVIVGGGAAGQMAAQTLREEGFAGRVVLVSADAATPYDRTKLSKAYLAGKAKPASLPLREEDFYAKHHIELLTNTRATGLDLEKKQVLLADAAPLSYDQLLLAPGGTPKSLPKLPGHDLQNVLLLRTQADANAIIEAAKEARHVVIIGSSFIGMEAASSLAGQDDRTVTVIAQEKEPFEKVLGPEVGKMFRTMHQEKGVQFEAEAEVAELTGQNGRVAGVRLKSSKDLPADLVVLGVGVRPATDFLKETFQLEKDGGLQVDEYLQAAPNIYAAGDIAHFPATTGDTLRIEHWRVAQQHGRLAARNLMGQQVPYTAAPYFWTQQYGKSLRYAGHAEQWDDIHYLCDVAKQDFLAFYIQKGKVKAAAGMNHDPDMIYIEALLAANKMPAPADISEETNWQKLANQ
ncbi:FAD-dependent oxidoreductase [Hymenobacter profundi]|uniref:FAD-dependent oxidoreductase n=1 Tax=Hymenobacter profundi TaxID=1982110 RepID=A0ABS6X4F9_9BACT|nr:FAD-dependent oxidoreductase [Hymenobacter profundi]MBW3130702.1 FAD-dependent oxidoreductase [Hymenobacter profundi]